MSTKGEPLQVSQITPHRNGVYTVHEAGGKVLSGSKDGSAVAMQLSPAGLAIERPYELGLGVIKSARWWHAGPTCFAAGTAKGHLAVVDTRTAGGGSSKGDGEGPTVLDYALRLRIDCVRWSPRNDHHLLTSGGGRAMHVFDIRSLRAPLFELKGHTRVDVKNNYAPCFTHEGRGISSLGEGTNTLSVFDSEDGTRVSEGVLVDVRGGAPWPDINSGGTLEVISIGGVEVLMLGVKMGLQAFVPSSA